MKESRIKFFKGEQRRFLDLCIEKLNLTSARGLLQYGFKTNYSSIKNYYCERRLIPSSLFYDLCYLSKINPETIKFEIINGNWGQSKGGKISRR
jgi:hypothetical protein